jgi:hypothetical protein
MEISDEEAIVLYKALKRADLSLHDVAVLWGIKERLSEIASKE